MKDPLEPARIAATNAAHFRDAAPEYDQFRPRPPADLAPLALRYAGVARARRVVDLGCGTGLSTRLWADAADEVLGVDPSPEMLDTARRATRAPHVRYAAGHGGAIPVEDGSADVVTVVQALHWMEPQATLAEIARVLRPGGVLVAADTKFPPAIHASIDDAFDAFLAAAGRALAARGLAQEGAAWSKEGHLDRMRASGHFRAAREIELHTVERGDAARLVAFARTAAPIERLADGDVGDEELGLDRLRAAAESVMRGEIVDWVFGYRVRMATK